MDLTANELMSIRNCVVFGGSKGIGKAICARFLKDNFRVAVISRNKENVDDCLDYLRGLEGN